MKGSVKHHVIQVVPSLAALILMIAAASLASNRFFSAANLRNVMTQTAVLAAVSVAQCLVLLIGGIDMSASSVISISTILVAMFSGSGLSGLMLSMLLALAVGAAAGIVNGIGVAELKMPAMIITISTQAFIKGIALLFMPSSGGQVNQAFMKFLRARLGIIPMAFLFVIALYLAAFIILHDTSFGRKVYAMGNGALYAEQSGINTRGMTIAVYTLAGMISSFAGILLSARIASGNPLVGDGYAMDSIAAAVIGGTSMNGGIGSVLGALFGSVILTLINNIMNGIGISPYYQYMLKGMILMLSLLLFQMKRRRDA